MEPLRRRSRQHQVLARGADRREQRGKLEIAWRWTTPDRTIETKAPFGNLKGTPLMVGGVLYAVSSLNLVTALDARTGQELWTYDPKAYLLHKPTHGGFTQRGLEHWSDGQRSRILLVTSTHQLVSLDAATGKPDPSFGVDGVVDMRADVAAEKTLELTGMNSPPIVCGDTVMMGRTGYDFPAHQDASRPATSAATTCAPARRSGCSTPFRRKESPATRPGSRTRGATPATPTCGR